MLTIPRAFSRSVRWRGLAALVLLTGCESPYYSVMESFGVEKRDILKDRVVDARTDQQEAKEQFTSTLEAFKAASGFKGGDLENLYDKLAGELNQCEIRAESVHSSVDSIADVSNDLFSEWKRENRQITDAGMRSQDLALLEQTKARYEQVIEAMHKSEKTMDPVLAKFNDQVLFLKHNLNAAAISSLYGNVVAIEADVGKLIKDMEASIAEADAFIKTLN